MKKISENSKSVGGPPALQRVDSKQGSGSTGGGSSSSSSSNNADQFTLAEKVTHLLTLLTHSLLLTHLTHSLTHSLITHSLTYLCVSDFSKHSEQECRVTWSV